MLGYTVNNKKNDTRKDYYFASYSHLGIHEEMIKDKIRTETYKNAIELNSHLFNGKIVLDVGCGTGILCLFAARAGARHVIGIEAADIANLAKLVVDENNLDSIITIIKGKVEDVELPHGIKKVDIIISEWMGYSLFFESMLSTVLYARNKWLQNKGLIFPDIACLYVAAIENKEVVDGSINWWNDVYGFDLTAMKDLAIKEPIIDTVLDEKVVTDCVLVKKINLYKAKQSDVSFTSKFTLRALRDDYIHGIMTFFTVEFKYCHTKTEISTSPFEQNTHWKQTTFYFESEVYAKKDEEINGEISFKPNPRNIRDQDVNIFVDFEGKYGSLTEYNFYKLR